MILAIDETFPWSYSLGPLFARQPRYSENLALQSQATAEGSSMSSAAKTTPAAATSHLLAKAPRPTNSTPTSPWCILLPPTRTLGGFGMALHDSTAISATEAAATAYFSFLFMLAMCLLKDKNVANYVGVS